MSAIILIPALLCTIGLYFYSPGKVFRDIVLPVLLLLPSYYFWKVALLPPIRFSDAVLLPLGIGIASRSFGRWRFSPMDLLIVLFVLSSGVSDRLMGHTTLSTFELFDSVCSALVPYMVGKVVLEAGGQRLAMLKRMIILIFIGAVIGSYEFVGKQNPFRMLMDPLFRSQLWTFPWVTQIRYGFGRVSNAYADAELAGIMMFSGALLTFWLARYGNWGGRFRNALWLPIRKSSIIFCMMIVSLGLTQSRGPELGFLFSLPVALVGRSRRVLRAAGIALLVVGLGAGLAYNGLIKYSATTAPTSDEQQTATYRAILLKNYLPMAEHDGPWGLGPNFPRMGSGDPLTGQQDSIDNEYLLLWLVQGWVGLGSFLLIICGTIGNLVWSGIYLPEKPDRAFAFTLLSIILGMGLTIATVYLGMQPFIFFFLFVGWGQAMKVPTRVRSAVAFERIYT